MRHREIIDNEYEINYNDRLISDSIRDLNRNATKEVYCFSKEQADEILKKCRFKCSVKTKDNVFIIRREERYKHRKKREEKKDE